MLVYHFDILLLHQIISVTLAFGIQKENDFLINQFLSYLFFLWHGMATTEVKYNLLNLLRNLNDLKRLFKILFAEIVRAI